LIEAAQTALQWLDDDEPSATSLVHQALQALHAQQHVEPRFADIAQVLQSALSELQDACHDLQHHARRTETDSASLEALDERLSQWLSLARRYRCAPEELPHRWAEWKAQLAALEQSTDLDALQARATQAEKAFRTVALQVSGARKQAANDLGKEITQAMQGLGMAGGRFEVQLQPLDLPQAQGLETVEFLVAGHPGSPPKPVGKVASGGELSRIALAISVVTSQLGQAPTLIFDEVDSGIGGTVAQTVGQLMKKLGNDRQVLAVTHLPQVAACAHHHLHVAKTTDAGGSFSQVNPIGGAARVQELARMLGGQPGSAVSLAHAQEMLHT
jgi:DNA repair protein RecN (Recombination protein N)